MPHESNLSATIARDLWQHANRCHRLAFTDRAAITHAQRMALAELATLIGLYGSILHPRCAQDHRLDLAQLPGVLRRLEAAMHAAAPGLTAPRRRRAA